MLEKFHDPKKFSSIENSLEFLDEFCVAYPYQLFIKRDRIYNIDEQRNFLTKKNDFLEDLFILILVVQKSPKEISSTSGMIESAKTSELLKNRVSGLPKKLEKLENAIIEQDYSDFNELIMKDSNSLHSICSDTLPPIFY